MLVGGARGGWDLGSMGQRCGRDGCGCIRAIGVRPVRGNGEIRKGSTWVSLDALVVKLCLGEKERRARGG